MGGKSWWDCGESVAGNTSEPDARKHATLFEIYLWIVGGLAGGVLGW
jgi:hypothetical protein